MPSNATPPLSNHCNQCGQKTNLSRCGACKVVFYCSREHQVADRRAHKHACDIIVHLRQNFEAEETRLREFPGNASTPANPFETCVGNFWGVVKTRDYMRARSSFADALGRAGTHAGVEAQLEHFMDMLRLSRRDQMNLRSAVPALMLRLGKDQECYDFVKWWTVVWDDLGFEWDEDPGMPDWNLEGEDAFQDVDVFCVRFCDLAHAVPVVLLKIRLLLDLQTLQNIAQETDGKVPSEIRSAIQSHAMISGIVRGNREILDARDHSVRIKALVSQIRALVAHVYKTNSWFWGLLLDQDSDQEDSYLPEYEERGSFEEAEMVLDYTREAWLETDGAIDLARDCFEYVRGCAHGSEEAMIYEPESILSDLEDLQVPYLKPKSLGS